MSATQRLNRSEDRVQLVGSNKGTARGSPLEIPRVTSRKVVGLDAALWLIALSASLAAPILPELAGVGTADILLGLLVLIFGIGAFLEHGGRYLTGAGIYTLTASFFIGTSLLYFHSTNPTPITSIDLYNAGIWSFWATAAIYLFWLRRSRYLRAPTAPRLSRSVTSFARNYALILLAVGLGMHYGRIRLGTIDTGATFDGAILLAASFVIGAKRRQPVWRVLISALALALYIVSQFHGGGRLVLADLGFGFLLLVQPRIRFRQVKLSVLVLTIPVLVIFALIGQSRPGAPTTEAASGLSSVVTPLQNYDEEVNLSLDHGGVRPLVADATFFVPRSVYPSKYLGFGRTLAQDLQPQIYSDSGGIQSLASLNSGEWFYIAGWAGILIMIPFTGFVFLLIDRLWFARLARLRSSSGLLVILALVVLAAGAPDLSWAGPDTWWGRATPRLLVLIPGAIWLVLPRRTPMRHRTELAPEEP